MSGGVLGRLWRGCLHQGGGQALEWIATGAVVAAMLAAIVIGAQSRGGEIGDGVVNVVVNALNGGGMAASASSASPSSASRSSAGPASSALTGPVVAIPATVAQQSAQNPLASFWASLPLWLQGGLIALGGALVVGLIFVGLVALGIITAVSLPVAAIIAGVGLVLAFIGGAIYAVATGKIDPITLFLLGAGIQFVTIAVGVWVASGAAAAALGWIRSVAVPWIARQGARVVGWIRNTAVPWITAQGTRLINWIRNTAVPWIARQGARFVDWIKNTVIPWIKDGPAWLARWVKAHPIQAAIIYRIIEEIAKGSYAEGLFWLLVLTVGGVLWKNPLALVVIAALKGLYSRYKEEIHKLFPWLPKLP
jgi:hypothetical protein